MALIARWKFDEAASSDAAADAVGTLNLNPVSSPLVVTGRIDGARSFSGDSHFYLGDGSSLASVAAGDWTLTGWLASSSAGVERALFSLGTTSAWSLRTYLTSSDGVAAGWNGASGFASVADVSSPVPATGAWIHWAARKEGRVLSLFVHGARVAQATLSEDPISGASHNIRIGVSGSSLTGDARYANGLSFDDFRIYNTALGDAEIRTVAWSGAADTSGPVISNVSPVAGSTIGQYDAWSGRVTDDAAFRRIMLWVKLTDSDGTERGREVIWDGTEFAAQYASSTRTEVTAGLVYDFTIRRTGGWPRNPEVFASAIDTSGNEGT